MSREKGLAIITARGGSKRIPGKNIRPFCGRPIIEYSIKAALDSDIFAEVMVSTDSEEIAEVAKKCGAQVPFFRSSENAGDYATTADVLMEVLTEYEKRGRTFPYFACLYPTAPFVTPQRLCEAVCLLDSSQGDCLIPVVAFSYPPQRAFVIQEGAMRYLHPGNYRKRSQDLEKMYHDCGQFYFYKTQAFLKKKGVFLKNIIPMEIPETQVQDIDTPEDWEIAEIKYKQMIKEQEKKEGR